MSDESTDNPTRPPYRPTTFTVDLGDRICAELADGKSLRTICEQDDMPTKSTVLLWVVKGDRGDEAYSDFSDQYKQAREAQSHSLMDDVIDIADDSHGDVKVIQGREVMDAEFVARSRLRVDARFKLAAQMHPKAYGDRIKQEVTGKDGGPIELSDAKSALLRGLVSDAPAE